MKYCVITKARWTAEPPQRVVKDNELRAQVAVEGRSNLQGRYWTCYQPRRRFVSYGVCGLMCHGHQLKCSFYTFLKLEGFFLMFLESPERGDCSYGRPSGRRTDYYYEKNKEASNIKRCLIDLLDGSREKKTPLE